MCKHTENAEKKIVPASKSQNRMDTSQKHRAFAGARGAVHCACGHGQPHTMQHYQTMSCVCSCGVAPVPPTHQNRHVQTYPLVHASDMMMLFFFGEM